MSAETTPADNTQPEKNVPPEVLEQIYKDIEGGKNPDDYLERKRERDPSPAQRAYRDETVEHPERLN